jgi:bacteriocin-like protein
MTNKEKAEKNTALAGEVAELSKELSDDDLEQVSGGAFNSDVVNRLGLNVYTNTFSNTQGLLARVTHTTPGGKSTNTTTSQVLSENMLRKYLAKDGILYIEAKNNLGAYTKISLDELAELLS